MNTYIVETKEIVRQIVYRSHIVVAEDETHAEQKVKEDRLSEAEVLSIVKIKKGYYYI